MEITEEFKTWMKKNKLNELESIQSMYKRYKKSLRLHPMRNKYFNKKGESSGK